MQNSPEQPRTIWNSTEQHGTARNSTEQHGTARNSTEQVEHCGEGWILSRTVAGRMGKRQWADLTCVCVGWGRSPNSTFPWRPPFCWVFASGVASRSGRAPGWCAGRNGWGRVRFFKFYRVGRVRDASAAVAPCRTCRSRCGSSWRRWTRGKRAEGRPRITHHMEWPIWKRLARVYE
eukprot:gene19098-biopygen17470